eukprot:g452.t1
MSSRSPQVTPNKILYSPGGSRIQLLRKLTRNIPGSFMVNDENSTGEEYTGVSNLRDKLRQLDRQIDSIAKPPNQRKSRGGSPRGGGFSGSSSRSPRHRRSQFRNATLKSKTHKKKQPDAPTSGPIFNRIVRQRARAQIEKLQEQTLKELQLSYLPMLQKDIEAIHSLKNKIITKRLRRKLEKMRKHNVKRRVKLELLRQSEDKFSLKEILDREAENYRRELQTEEDYHDQTFITSKARSRRVSTVGSSDR